MAIIDNRTLLSGFETGDTVTTPDDLSGAAGGTADTVIFIQGLRSFGFYSGSTRDGLLYDHGTAQDWSNNTFYFWVNCGIVGLLDTIANGGMRARFCGATVGDFFEVNIAGSDSFPAAVSGGWAMFVVDIEKAKTASDATGGTPPATTAIRYAGISTITPTMPRMVDNTWFDACWRLPTATPGILVEGQNSGSVDWTLADIVAASKAGAWGTAKLVAGGATSLNTPVQFGANDAVTHGFSDTSKTILWEDWDVDDTPGSPFYGLQIIGGTGTQSFELGIKTGTGDDATGAQGCNIQADGAGARWFFDADDANVDACNLYGCNFIHGDDFQLDTAQVSCINTLFIDCTSAVVSNAEILRCSIINANTADDVAFMTTDDLGDIVFCTFEFSDGHAIKLTTPRVAAQISKGNVYTGYGATASTDAAVENDTGGLVTINVSDSGDSPTYQNVAAATTAVENPVTTTLTDILDGSEVRFFLTSDRSELDGIESLVGTTFVYSYNFVLATAYYIRIFKDKYVNEYLVGNHANSNQSIKITQDIDRNDP